MIYFVGGFSKDTGAAVKQDQAAVPKKVSLICMYHMELYKSVMIDCVIDYVNVNVKANVKKVL